MNLLFLQCETGEVQHSDGLGVFEQLICQRFHVADGVAAVEYKVFFLAGQLGDGHFH